MITTDNSAVLQCILQNLIWARCFIELRWLLLSLYLFSGSFILNALECFCCKNFWIATLACSRTGFVQPAVCSCIIIELFKCYVECIFLQQSSPKSQRRRRRRRRRLCALNANDLKLQQSRKSPVASPALPPPLIDWNFQDFPGLLHVGHYVLSSRARRCRGNEAICVRGVALLIH